MTSIVHAGTNRQISREKRRLAIANRPKCRRFRDLKPGCRASDARWRPDARGFRVTRSARAGPEMGKDLFLARPSAGLRPMKTFVRHSLACLLSWIACLGTTASGAQFRISLPGLLAPPPADLNYSTAEFDFGMGFRRIDSVSLAFYAPGGFGGLGIVTNGFSYASVRTLLSANLDNHDVDELLLPSSSEVIQFPFPCLPVGDPGRPTVLLNSFALNNLDILDDPGVVVEDIAAWGRSFRDGLPEQIVPLALTGENLPDFMLSGRGELAMGGILTYVTSALPPFATKPPLVVRAALVLEGVAVPEPFAMPMAAMALIAVAARRRVVASPGQLVSRG